MKLVRHAISASAMLAVLAFTAVTPVEALEIQVTVDSSSVAAATAGSLDFQFSAGDSSAQTATAVVTGFSSTALTMGDITFTNSASGGPLPSNVTVQNDPAFLSNRARQAVTYGSGSSMSFILNISGNALTTSGTADSTFYFSLLDTSNQSILSGQALPHLTITIPANGSGIPVISSISLITASVVPEPGSIAMTGIAAAVLAFRLNRRKWNAA